MKILLSPIGLVSLAPFASAWVIRSATVAGRRVQSFASFPMVSVDPLPKLKNRYFALRHGLSTANVAGIISSLPTVGTSTHGLTEEGRTQSRESAKSILRAIGGEDELERLVVYSSDFTRARETAEEAVSALYEGTGQAPPRVLTLENLRERFFGELDGTDVGTYNDVWPLDLEDAHHTTFGVESVNSVAQRTRKMFLQLEAAHPEGGKPILLTSHADTLQIMQCFVAGADCRLFSQYRFKNGEVRALGESPSTLPVPTPLSRDISRV